MKTNKCCKKNGAEFDKKQFEQGVDRGTYQQHSKSGFKTNSDFFKKDFCNTKNTKQVRTN